MRSTLRIRLTLWYVGLLAAVLLIFSFGVYSLLAKSFLQRLDSGLGSATQVTALALNHETEEHNGREGGEESTRQVLNTMHQTSFPRADIAVWDGGRLVAEKPGIAGLPASVAGLPKAASEAQTSFHSMEQPSGRYRVAVVQVWVPASRARYTVVANESLQPVEAEMRAVAEVLLITVPICLMMAALVGYFLARKSLAPVQAMAATAAQISSHNLDQRLAAGNPQDELGVLAETFNRVFERLQQSFEQQRQFMADASHELRTPISVALIATQVSRAHRHHSIDELYDTLEVVQAQMVRLRRVVEDMFTLAQADTGVYEPARTTFYLDEVVAESVRAGRVLGNARDVSIRVGHLASEAAYEGDEGLLRQLILILLDNAVKYTPAGGSVDISLFASDSTYRVRVADTGCGIPVADQPYIFRRFYRADKARSRKQPGAGSGAGLGLAIAQWITRLHHGKIWLEKSDANGSVFWFELPANMERPSPAPVAEGALRH